MSTIHVRLGEGRHYPMTDGDHIARATVQDACDSVPTDQPAQDSMTAILSVTSRHGVALAGVPADLPRSGKDGP